MNSPTNISPLGKIAHDAYAKKRLESIGAGDDAIPSWEHLDSGAKEAWEAAARALMEPVEGIDEDTVPKTLIEVAAWALENCYDLTLRANHDPKSALAADVQLRFALGPVFGGRVVISDAAGLEDAINLAAGMALVHLKRSPPESSSGEGCR